MQNSNPPFLPLIQNKIRDYIHVMDLADGHIAALRKLFTSENIGELLFFFPCRSTWTNLCVIALALWYLSVDFFFHYAKVKCDIFLFRLYCLQPGNRSWNICAWNGCSIWKGFWQGKLCIFLKEWVIEWCKNGKILYHVNQSLFATKYFFRWIWNFQKIPVKLCPRRPGDATEVYASTQRAETELGWK